MNSYSNVIREPRDNLVFSYLKSIKVMPLESSIFYIRILYNSKNHAVCSELIVNIVRAKQEFYRNNGAL